MDELTARREQQRALETLIAGATKESLTEAIEIQRAYVERLEREAEELAARITQAQDLLQAMHESHARPRRRAKAENGEAE